MSLAIVGSLLRGEPRHGRLADRLQGFYGPQAAGYDAFRERLLHGRSELIADLPLPEGGTLVELGGGTGRNLAFLGDRLDRLHRAWLVDLCPALLARAASRWRDHAQVRTVEADACTWRPPQPVDAVLCSYALTMIPDWFAAIDNALAMLRPGGVIAVVDFFVARKHPAAGLARHGLLARHGWPLWFGHDGVHPSPDHLPYLQSRCETIGLHQDSGRVPWLCGLRAPYYRFLGRKPRS